MNPIWLLVSSLLGGLVATIGSYFVNHYLPRKQIHYGMVKSNLDEYAMLSARYWLKSWETKSERMLMEIEMKLLLLQIRRSCTVHLDKYQRKASKRKVLAELFRQLITQSTGSCFECNWFEISSDRARRCADITSAMADELLSGKE